MYLPTSQFRARLAPWNWFKPSSKIFYWPFQCGTSFVDHLCYLCLVIVMLSRLFIATLWSPAGKMLTSWLLFAMFNCTFVTFPCGILGQVCYLVVLIPDLCPLLLWLCTCIYTVNPLCPNGFVFLLVLSLAFNLYMNITQYLKSKGDTSLINYILSKSLGKQDTFCAQWKQLRPAAIAMSIMSSRAVWYYLSFAFYSNL